MKKALILRGPCGSGKSTLANKIAEKTHAIICEADEYFIRPDGVYDFNYKLLSNAHEFCFMRFENALSCGCDVVVSNTNIKLWEFKKYLDKAKEAGYEIEVIRLTTDYGNVHGVPEEKVNEMRDRIENYEGEILIK